MCLSLIIKNKCLLNNFSFKVITEGGSNMVKAFKSCTEITSGSLTENDRIVQDFESLCHSFNKTRDEEEFNLKLQEDSEDEDESTGNEQELIFQSEPVSLSANEFEQTINSFCSIQFGVSRMGCCTHELQLGVKDAF